MNTNTESREGGVRALAIVGFIALVAAGMWLAIYSARFVPGAVNQVGSAAVALFKPSPSDLAVVPNGSTTAPFVDATTTYPVYTPFPTSPPATDPVPSPISPAPTQKPVTPKPGPRTTTTTTINGSGSASSGSGYVAPYGLPDLVVAITSPGYLTSASTDSFVPTSQNIPFGARAAVKFVIRNVGTGVASPWHFSARIPTTGSYAYFSPLQQSLNPGDSIEYVLGFDQVASGNQTITITANATGELSESNTNNNVATAAIYVSYQN